MAKIKTKTHKATKKRFKLSAKGKMQHFHQGDNAHLKVNKSSRRLRRQEGRSPLAATNQARKLKNLLNS